MRGDRLTVRTLVTAVLELLDEVGVDSAHVLGSSMGGATALQLALTAPERVRRLVLFRAGYTHVEPRHDPKFDMSDPERWRRLGLEQWMSRIHETQGGPDAWKTVIRRVAGAFDAETTDHVHKLEELHVIGHPTLLIVGDRDPLVPLQQVLDMYEVLPNAALWVLPKATHITATNTWRRACFDREVSRFLRQRQ